VAGRPDSRTVGLSVPLWLIATGAFAQVAPNRAALYLYPTDVSDARALWVNPAGLGRAEQASVHIDVTVGDPGSGGRLRQLTTSLSSRGFALGYQRDLFDGGVRGGTSGTGWDVGAVYDLTPSLTIGATVANVGRPVVRDSTLPVTYTPGATFRLSGARAAFSADAQMTSDGVTGYAFGATAGLRQGTPLPLGILLRVDTDRSLRRAAFAFGLSVGKQDLVGAVATTPGDLGRLDAVSLYGVSTRRLTRR